MDANNVWCYNLLTCLYTLALFVYLCCVQESWEKERITFKTTSHSFIPYDCYWLMLPATLTLYYKIVCIFLQPLIASKRQITLYVSVQLWMHYYSSCANTHTEREKGKTVQNRAANEIQKSLSSQFLSFLILVTIWECVAVEQPPPSPHQSVTFVVVVCCDVCWNRRKWCVGE